MRGSRATAVAGVLLLAAGCVKAPERVWHEEAGLRWAELPPPGRGKAGFTQLEPGRTGVGFVNRLVEEDFLGNRHFANGSGVALGDVDGDGLPDVYLAGLSGPNTLYRNLGDWRFEDVTERAGLRAAGRFSTGTAFADVDGDGDVDLLLTAMGGPTSLFLNDGAGRFTETTLSEGGGPTSMALADADADGDLDLYVGHYRAKTVKDQFPPWELAFERVVERQGDAFAVAPAWREHYRLERQGNRLMRLERAEPDRYYVNDGAGNFTRSEGTFGETEDWALAVRFQDIDGDGHPDLFVCNDFESPDRIWLGDGAGGFRAAPRTSFRKTAQSSMSVAIADVNADGYADIFVADMLSADYARRKRQVEVVPPEITSPGDLDARPQVMQNMLYLGRGDGTFAETARMSGVHASEWTWSSAFVDVDLDGREDLLITNGHLYDAMDADTQMRLQAPRADWRRALLEFPDLDLKNLAFRNRGDGTFEMRSDGWGIGREADVSHGMALADLDLDGDQDVVVNRLNRAAGLYRNDAPGSRMAVRLRGQVPNTFGIGARIRVSGSGLPLRTREVIAGGEYLSSSEPLQTFAAGTDTLRIEVDWRSGRRSVVEGARGGRIYEIQESAAAQSSARAAGMLAPFTEMPTAFTHREAPYDDFARQPLLPGRLSQRGPALAVVDYDHDGDDDLVVGNGRTGRLTVLPYVSDTFGPGFGIGANLEGDVAGLVVHVGGRHPPRVFAAVANWERTPDTAGDSSYVAVIGEGRLPFGPDAAGPLVLADFDGDADLDLFAGGQFVPGRYGEAATSRVYLNNGGTYALDVRFGAALDEVGMVSDAAAGDLDGDGTQDLVLATEWGPVKVLFNRGGFFEERTEALGLSGLTGIWTGVALGDFDADGRPDIVATNRGWNTTYGRPESGRAAAVRLFRGDIDRNGIEDLFEAHREIGAWAPLRDLKSLTDAVPLLRARVPSYESFSRATLRDAIGPAFDDLAYGEAGTLASSVFLNRGDRFEVRSLPSEAQRSPAFAAVVADWDGDGREDLFLSQNFFAVPFGIPRSDAGRGLVLLGDGAGGFAAVAGGIALYGEQRAAATGDFNADGRADLAITQNAGPLRAFLNAGARVGLRIELRGPAGNPTGIGAVVRLRRGDGRLGPARLQSAGSGYRAQNAAVFVLGGEAESVYVLWPDGRETEAPVAPGTLTVRVVYD